MATRKPVVLSVNGNIEEIQSGDSLDNVPTSSGFYLQVQLGDPDETGNDSVTGLIEIVAIGSIDRDSLPTSISSIFSVRGNIAGGGTVGDVRLNAVQGMTTSTLGTNTISSSTVQWLSTNVSANLLLLGAGIWRLEVEIERTSGTGSVNFRNGVLEVVDA